MTLGFVLDFGGLKKGVLKIAASSVYKVFADGELILYGPQRAAHGFARVTEVNFLCRVLVVEALNYGVKTFCAVLQPPFFAADVQTADGEAYSAADFACYRLTDRVRKVQRYSYQRGFAEVYRMDGDRTSLYRGEPAFEKLKTIKADLPKLQPSRVDNAKLRLHKPLTVAETGAVSIDPEAQVWRDRAHTWSERR